MKIYKRPANLVFDTENQDIIIPEFIPPLEVMENPMVHEVTDMMTIDFLSQFFEKSKKRTHLIFENFG
ncbi:hypothetical protein [Tenacibaculum piscium]|uniref:hypothetical protein n=1 Tax=Tenacibaculum piscium TaxID=1458515 RepID=UPI001F45BB30|nr:hypothetical protein [Tenacibaculum piscium]